MRTWLLLLLAAFSMVANASSTGLGLEYCFDDAAKKAGVNRNILIAIAAHESSLHRDAINTRNQDGSEDVGVMQINSQHYEWLSEVGIERGDLFNTCVNIHIGAIILRKCLDVYGNTWAAVGAYNAGFKKTPKAKRARQRYANLIWRKYRSLFGTSDLKRG